MKTTVKTKLFAGFGFVLVLMALVVTISIYRLSILNQKLIHLVDTTAEKIKLNRKIIHAIHEINLAKDDLLLSGSPEDAAEPMKRMDEFTIELDLSLKQLYSLAGPIGQAQLDEFSQWWGKYADINDQITDLVRSDRRGEARELYGNKSRELIDRAEAIINTLFDRYEQQLEEEKEEGARTYILARKQEIAFLLTAIIVGVLVAFFIIHSIITRTYSISEKAGKIAAGLILPEEEEKGCDELTPIAISFQEISQSFAKITKQAQEIAQGNFATMIELRSKEDELGVALQKMTRSLRDSKEETENRAWLRIGQNQLNETMSGEQTIPDLGRNIITYLAEYLDAQIGALYLAGKDSPDLRLCGSYAFDQSREIKAAVIKIGEGLVGQAALEKKMTLITNIPQDYAQINSAIGQALPRHILISPFLFEGELKGVIELGSFREFSNLHLEFLNMVISSVAIAIHTAQSRAKIQALLEESQRMTEELQVQQEELRAANEELEAQTQSLKQSQQRLQVQQEELQTTNEELEEKTESLERQKADIKRKNYDLEAVRRDLEQKAEELALASKYKSEFLANMSHELRTPLNSLLILSQSLADNPTGNLTDHQIESLGVIYSSGKDLLELINEILDLSKIEAGRMEAEIKEVLIRDLAEDITMVFQHIIDDKGLGFQVVVKPDLPESIFSDRKRVEQIIKNLMSNAVKFTEEGTIILEFKKPDQKTNLTRSGLLAEKAVAISITDTGIGIPLEKQKVIFEAFQQADGGTSRKYGGTGLGLSICRELAGLLGGEIQLTSEPGKGSTFTLFLPIKREARASLEKTSEDFQWSQTRPWVSQRAQQPAVLVTEEARGKGEKPIPVIPDDRDDLKEGDIAILVIEDDQHFAKILMDQCHQRDFRCLISATGEGGLNLAAQYQPKAIILDLVLPGINGWQVMESLKNNAAIRHIPVHIISMEERTIDAFRKGAIGFLTKPVEKEKLEEVFTRIEKIIEKDIKDLLIVEDNRILRERIVTLIGNGDVKVTQAENGAEAIKSLQSGKFDCMVLDLGLPDMSGFELLKILEKDKQTAIPPVIIYTGRELTREEDEELRNYAESIIVKGVKSEERLLDETALFLHRIVNNLPEKKKEMIVALYDKDMILQGKKILLVDDDMRNVYALSKILQDKGMKVLKAEDGKKALSILEQEPDVDLVLMDIMMPVMDGYEAIRKIKAQPKFWNLPIIALTAKAMKEDREKCLSAGAGDYLPKPVEVGRLLSMMRVWLYR